MPVTTNRTVTQQGDEAPKPSLPDKRRDDIQQQQQGDGADKHPSQFTDWASI